jgi:hypothetical protein
MRELPLAEEINFKSRALPFLLQMSESLIDAQFQASDQSLSVVCLTSLGRILRRRFDGGEQEVLAACGGHLDLSKPTRMSSYGQYIAIVNEFGTNGIVVGCDNRNWEFNLERGDYCAHVSSFPIAFFTQNGAAHLIHGTDWNRLDITSLETKKCLTERVVSYEPPLNYADYFHGSLLVSPDEQHFISTGWHWQPTDAMRLWRVPEFENSFELGYRDIDHPRDADAVGCVWNRPVCFVDDDIIGYGHNRCEGLDDNGTHSASEIILHNIVTGEIVQRLPFDHFAFETSQFEITGDLCFDRDRQTFITFSDKHDLTITDRLGNVIGQKNIRPKVVSIQAGAALVLNGTEIEIASW